MSVIDIEKVITPLPPVSPEWDDLEREHIIAQRVLLGAGRYLRLVALQQQEDAPEVEPTPLTYFPILAGDSAAATAHNAYFQSGRAAFIRKLTASPRAEPVNRMVDIGVTPDSRSFEVRTVSSMDNCVLVEQRHFDTEGNTTGYTYWAHPPSIFSRLIDEPFDALDQELADAV